MKLKDVLEAAASLVRTGWMQRGVPPQLGETVALHSFYAALIALELGLRLKNVGVEVNPERAASIAIAHDLPEVLVGDLPKWTTDKIGDIKESLELKAIGEMDSLEVVEYSKAYIDERGRERALAKVSETLATLWQAEKYLNMGFSRVKEIRDTMVEHLSGIIKKVLEEDEEFGKALVKVLGELDEGLQALRAQVQR
ncbi:YfbR-like 5'-deoxynucleotidase [Ignicoccus hospitalis]|uniref:Metal dependent phosphohydrolase n=1 Tax=Ignicoccus hospitalis (strain KIN4/I / DSM 18386 / JCM 14125) TaxID=453591 RepID=A8A8R3_IGNH4|nr:YfbR-like 5'-deoxynucleotidase [Ignicoccus hospitalis]ABU81315.1 metal dependent phosphohydrolase [Ignicoccus hospitalis KIN4/I]HIH90381.1 HD domain-containing protein [Desulfurococcaceae archaeon]